MFKNFHGFQLVDEYHLWKKEHRQNNNPLQIKILKLTVAITATLFCWIVPTSFFNITGLTVVEQRIIAVFVFAALMWLFDAVPAWTTSLVVVVLLLFCTSDSSLWFMRESVNIGKLVSYKAILHCFADPIIMLFIGGFIIAIASSKSGLDVKLAKALLTPFGTKSENVMLGFLLVTGVFSMFISNTATAAMMLTFLSPVLKALPADATGFIKQKDMVTTGLIMGTIGLILGYIVLMTFGQVVLL